MLNQLPKHERTLLYINGKYVIFPCVVFWIGCHIIFSRLFSVSLDQLSDNFGFLVWGLLFVFGGVIWAYINFYNGRYKIALIEKGVVTSASLAAKKDTYSQVNRRNVYKLIYEFRPQNGYRYKVSKKTIYPNDYKLGSKIDVVYLEKQPRRNLIVIDLPSRVASFVLKRAKATDH